MKGSFYRRGCSCKKKKCTCGAKWSFTIDIGINPETGKRRQKSKGGFKTKAEAEQKAAEIYHEFTIGTYIEEKNITFEKFAEYWMINYEKSVKVSTVRARNKELKYLMSKFRYLNLKDITKKMYQDRITELKGHLSYNTVNGIHTTGRMIFSKAIELDVIKKDPTLYAKIPNDKKTLDELESEVEIPKYLEKEELNLFLATAKEKGLSGDYIMFKLLSYTGMRVGEVCALKWKDISFEDATISISKTYYSPSNNTVKYELLTPKTRTSKRLIEVDYSLLDDLKEHKKAQAKVRIRNADVYHQEDFVLGLLHGKNIGYPAGLATARTRMLRLLKLSGLNPCLTPHTFRHTHTSLLAEAGVGLTEIMERLGHKSDSITRNIYLHVTKAKRKEAAKKFSDLMNGF